MSPTVSASEYSDGSSGESDRPWPRMSHVMTS
jgi:hypothetical protein